MKGISRLAWSAAQLLVLLGAGQAFLVPSPASPPAAASRCRQPWAPCTVGGSSSCSLPSPQRQPFVLGASSTSTASAAAAKMPAKRRDALEAEFKRAAGKEALVSFEGFLRSTEVAELLQEKLLAKAEVEAFWQGEVGPKDELADVEGFLAVHARIDALFEEDEDDVEDDEEEVDDEPTPVAAAASAAAAVPPGAMTLPAFLASPDVARYVEEGLVTTAEVRELWAAECAKAKLPAGDAPLGRDAQMNVYAAIEELLEEVDEDEDEEASAAAAPAAAADAAAAVPLGEDPEVWRAFVGASQDGRMDVQGFLRAGEMPELLREELLTQEEARRIWDKVAAGAGSVELGGYKRLLAAVDELFVDDDEEEAEEEEVVEEVAAPAPAAAAAAAPAPVAESPAAARAELLSLLSGVRFAGLLDPEDANVKARDEAVAALVEAMLDEEANLAVRDDLEIKDLEKAIEGDWELAYTTSRTMRFNRGLSGLGASLPKAEFLGFEQRIVVNGYALETVYTERLKTLGQPLDVVVESAWELKDVVSIMDGEVELIMDVLPAVIKYGFITERLETGWKGVRVLNRCELLYLDREMRVMKGQSNDSYFVFRRKG